MSGFKGQLRGEGSPNRAVLKDDFEDTLGSPPNDGIGIFPLL